MSLDLTQATPDDRLLFVGRVLLLLRRSAFRRSDEWSKAVVVLSPESKRVTSRACFASWLRANDLGTVATECTSRKVPSGCVLVWLEHDEGVGFTIVDLIAEVKALRSAAA